MLKKFLRSIITPPLNLSNIRGQAMVIFALAIPTFMLLLGVGMDLGWYYLNVSRLQNAADAAALAGARTIINSNSGKLKDLAPVLVQKLPADNGLTDDGEPKVETDTETETTQTSTESEQGTTITYTETTTTTTTTISKTQLEDLDWTDGDTTARNYTVKNIGTTQNVQTDEDETANLIIDNWSLFKSPSDKQVETDLRLVKVNGEFYYIVKLGENIKHFFLSGWFGGMDAKVVAIAQLVPKDQVVVNTSTEYKTWKEFIAKVREIINDNVIVGNWEVQDKYKDISGGSYTITLKAGDYLIDSSGHVVVDEDGNPVINEVEGKKITLTRAGKFYLTFGSDYYTGAWNHFQDFYNHYYLGDLYRKQMVVIKDDVIYEEDSNGVDIIDRNGTKGTITSYGKGKYGESSSVAATVASINTDASSSGYNPKHDGSEKKTYQDGISANDNKGDSKGLGYPFTWKRLDSINIDFRPEVKLSDKWLSEDWDLECGFDGVTTVHNQFETSGIEANKIRFDYVKRLRIHTSMNFEDPYKVRPDVDTEAEPDVLWARIESEPILNKPDVTDSSNLAGLSSIVSTENLNSVNQIILNFNQSNYNTNDQRYRPVIIFYDGPETYDNVLASYKAKPDIELEPNNSAAVLHRKSKPVIVNLNADFRGILYAPNSPVVVIGDHKDDFEGFIVAKKYMELKDDDDFISAEEYLSNNNQSDLIYTYAYRYFNNANRQYEYTREVNSDGTVQYRDLGGTKISGSVKKDTDAYRLKVYYDINEKETDPAKKKRYYKIYGKKAGATTSEIKAAAKSAANTYETINGMKYIKVIEENGIDMYVNDYGEIQFEDLPNPTKPWKCGVYDNFGRTDFTTHKYKVAPTSAENMLLSDE